MNINYPIVAIVLIALVLLIIFVIRKNQKEKKKLESSLNESELKPDEHDRNKEDI